MNPSKEYRDSWKLAQSFPVDKEAVYPEHGTVQEFDKHTGLRCLEYGCGGGSDTRSLLRRGNAVWYADIVHENVAITQAGVRGYGMASWPLCLEESDKIGLKDGFFDLVTSHGVLHHIPEGVERVVRELARVLRPGGLFYAMLYTEILERNYDAHARRLQREHGWTWERALSECTDPGTPYTRAYTEAEGRALFEGAGLTVKAAPVWNRGEFRTFQCEKGGAPRRAE